MATQEITYIVNYQCPRCRAPLEARTGQWHTWLRCPRCGRASLPPEPARRPPAPAPAPSMPVAPGEDVLVIGPLSADRAPSLAARTPMSNARRFALAVGILGSLMMLLISMLESNPVNMAIFTLTTIALLGYVAFSARR